jgi:anaerobic magnesium-protoporphyrin IX monomethyl ester cyclase
MGAETAMSTNGPSEALLIFAPYPYAKRFIPRQFPLGIGYISAVLREHAIDSWILDLSTRRYTDEQILRLLGVHSADVVGISAFTENFAEAAHVASLVREVTPDALIVLGGVHATFEYEALLREFPDIDVAAVGEGETTMLQICEAFDGRRTGDLSFLETIDGIAYREGTGITVTAPRLRNERLDELPFPAIDSLIEPGVNVYFQEETRSLPILTSRGCPYSCAFCSTAALHGREFRARSPVNVVDEIEERVEQYKLNAMSIVDDLFTFDKQRAKRICDEITRRGIEVSWGCSARVDTVDPDLLRTMRRAGCTTIFYGIESLSDEILALIGKGFTRQQVDEAIQWTLDEGLEVDASFILGLPGETRESLDLIPAFVEQHKLHDRVLTNNLQVLPGTPLFLESDRFGLSSDANLWAPWRELRSYVKGVSRRDILETILETKLAFHRNKYGDEGLFELEIPPIAIADRQ